MNPPARPHTRLAAAAGVIAAMAFLAGCTGDEDAAPAEDPTASSIPAPIAARAPGLAQSRPALPASVDSNVDAAVTGNPIPRASLILVGAEAVGCVDVQIAETAAWHTTSSGTCTYDGAPVRIYEFATANDYASFISDLEGAGMPVNGLVRRGPLVFAVEKSRLESLTAALDFASFPHGLTSLMG